MMRLPWPVAVALVCLAQLALAGYVVFERERFLAGGQTVRLAVEPVDPRDLLRGDYIILTYGISNLPLETLGAPADLQPGETVYAILEADGDVWRATALVREPPSGVAALRGKVRGVTRPVTGCGDDCSRRVIADYGIGRFFVPEGDGRSLEDLRNARRLSVDVVLGEDGEPALKALRIDGEIRYRVSLFR